MRVLEARPQSSERAVSLSNDKLNILPKSLDVAVLF